MSKKILLIVCLLSINNFALAGGDDSETRQIKAPASKKVASEELLRSTTVHPQDELTGNVSSPYRFQTEADASQTLGFLKSQSKAIANDTSSTADISPQEDLVSPETTPAKPAAPAPVAKPKTQKKKAKPAAKPTPKEKTEEHTVIVPKATPAKTVVANDAQPKDQPTSTTETTANQDAPEVKAAPTNEQLPESKPTSNQEPVKAIEPLNEQDAAPADATPAEPVTQSEQAIKELTVLEFNQSDIDLSDSQKDSLLDLSAKIKNMHNFLIKLQSYGSAASSDVAESRRISLQRAIKVRKFLIEHDVSPNSISVNALEDSANKSNKVEIRIEKNS